MKEEIKNLSNKGAEGLSIGLIDLDNKIKEAEYNALNYFNKNCPYCGNGIFDGHIRNKLNIDHFWPIAKGGQHVPWNILPICGKCNRRKKDKLPHDFLEKEIFSTCSKYLAKVKENYCNKSQSCCETVVKIKKCIIENKTLSPTEIRTTLYKIFETEEETTDLRKLDTTINWINEGSWKTHLNSNKVEKFIVYQLYIGYCKQNTIVPESPSAFGKKFIRTINCRPVRKPTGNRKWCYKIME